MSAPASQRNPTIHTTELDGHRLEYALCRVLPDTALVLRDVLREADRLWAAHLGAEVYDELRRSDAGEEFFSGRVRLEPVPPEREMVAVWLPFPPAFRETVRAQLVDVVEAYGSKDEPQQGAGRLP